MNSNKNSSNQTHDNEELLQCLFNLSAIGEGRDQNVDHEISQFKKMVKIGSSIEDLKNQVSVIAKTLTNVSNLPENDELVTFFQKMPAQILVDEISNHTLSEKIKIKLQNYNNTLTSTVLATTAIPDLLAIFEPEIVSDNTVIMDDIEDGFDATDFATIINPILDLFSKMELTPELTHQLTQMQEQSNDLDNMDDLSQLIENISQLILNSIANYQIQFETFLNQLKKRLNNVNESLLSSSENNDAISKNSASFSEEVSSQVNEIQLSFQNVDTIDQLESLISNSLELIVKSVNSFDGERKDLEKQSKSTIDGLTHELQQTRSEADNLKDNLQQQRNRALTDPLTKLPNRHAYNERLNLEYNRWRRYKKPLTLIMGDIDFFKKVNDTHGHVAGDTALKETAVILQDGLRSTDFIARFGGEEFVMIMPETNIIQATKAVNKIRLSIKENIVQEGTVKFQFTMSFGVACFEEDDTFITVLKRADKALYRAKTKGRNQVCIQRKS